MKRTKFDLIYPFEEEIQVPVPPFVEPGSGLEVNGLSISVKTEQPLENSSSGAVTLKTEAPLLISSSGGLGLRIGDGLKLNNDVLESTVNLIPVNPLFSSSNLLYLNFLSPLYVNNGYLDLKLGRGLEINNNSLSLIDLNVDTPLEYTNDTLSLNIGNGLQLNGSSLELNLGSGLQFSSQGELQLAPTTSSSRTLNEYLNSSNWNMLIETYSHYVDVNFYSTSSLIESDVFEFQGNSTLPSSFSLMFLVNNKIQIGKIENDKYLKITFDEKIPLSASVCSVIGRFKIASPGETKKEI